MQLNLNSGRQVFAPQRVDFTVDFSTGQYLKTPMDDLSARLTRMAQQFAESVTTDSPLRELLMGGYDPVRDAIHAGLAADAGLADIGISVVSLRIGAIQPTAEVEKALQMPTREAIQQSADQATFQRRAVAVENERAIAENELKNLIELARRKEELIAQQGKNSRMEATEKSEAREYAERQDQAQSEAFGSLADTLRSAIERPKE